MVVVAEAWLWVGLTRGDFCVGVSPWSLRQRSLILVGYFSINRDEDCGILEGSNPVVSEGDVAARECLNMGGVSQCEGCEIIILCSVTRQGGT